MLFGIFKNPNHFSGELGFGLPAKLPIVAVLLYRKVAETCHDRLRHRPTTQPICCTPIALYTKFIV